MNTVLQNGSAKALLVFLLVYYFNAFHSPPPFSFWSFSDAESCLLSLYFQILSQITHSQYLMRLRYIILKTPLL